MRSSSEEGSYLRLVDLFYHSTVAESNKDEEEVMVKLMVNVMVKCWTRRGWRCADLLARVLLPLLVNPKPQTLLVNSTMWRGLPTVEDYTAI